MPRESTRMTLEKRGLRSATRNRRRSAEVQIALWAAAMVIGVASAAGAQESSGSGTDATEGWLTNYDLLQDTAREAVADLMQGFDVAEGLPLRLEISPHETSWLVSELMSETLRTRGHPVIDDSSASALELTVRVVEAGLSYTDTHRRLWLGSKQVERMAVATLRGEVLDGGDRAWSGQGAARTIDEVPASKLRLVEGQTFPFTAPTLPAGNPGRVVEPLIVSAIVVGLVALFSANRN